MQRDESVEGFFRETDSHFPACEGFKRRDMGRAMGCSSVMPQKLGKLILPVKSSQLLPLGDAYSVSP